MATRPIACDPEVRAFVDVVESHYPPDAQGASVAQMRAYYDSLCEQLRAPRPQTINVTDCCVPARGLAPAVPVRHYRRQDVEPGGVTLLYFHGGGFVVGGLDSHDDVCAELADQAGLDVIAVDYRLAPENIYPAALDDVEAAYRYFEPECAGVILGGDSAGAHLATAMCFRARRLDLVNPTGQLLIYPGFAVEPKGGSYEENAHAPLLTTADCRFYFGCYAGRDDWYKCAEPELVPLSAENFSGLPAVMMVSAGLDPLRDDAEQYAQALARAGVPFEWRNEPELVHGYLRARHVSRLAAESFAWISNALRRLARLKCDK